MKRIGIGLLSIALLVFVSILGSSTIISNVTAEEVSPAGSERVDSEAIYLACKADLPVGFPLPPTEPFLVTVASSSAGAPMVHKGDDCAQAFANSLKVGLRTDALALSTTNLSGVLIKDVKGKKDVLKDKKLDGEVVLLHCRQESSSAPYAVAATSSSAGAPMVRIGENCAQAIADTVEAGFTVEGRGPGVYFFIR